jgi:Mce-associated membrane protein
MSRPTPRRPASSRGTTPRPRKIAGQGGAPRPEDVQDPAPADPAAPATPAAPSAPSAPSAPAAKVDLAKSSRKVAAASPAAPPDPGEDRPGILARQKTTRVLIATLALVALASVAQFGLLLWDRIGDDDESPRAIDDSGQITVPEGRPVVADELAVLEGVEKAAKAAQEIVAIDHEAYDEEVDKASELMTSSFEEQYRTTATDIREEFVANRTTVQANVVAQGVVRANRTRLEALIFLNQVVSREREGEPETVVTPYKVLVTMVHTDQGWLVDGLDTDAEQDKTN